MDQNSFEVTSLTPFNKSTFDFNRLLKWLIVLAVAAAIIGVVFFFFSRSTFSPSNVDLKITIPEEISSGEKVSYKIEYTNHNEKAIKDLQLTFFYPSDAVDIRNGKLTNLQTESLKLENLAPNEEKSVEFPAYLVGSKGDIKKARAILSFYGEGIQSIFKKETTVATHISSLPISLTLVSPPNAVSGQEVAYLLDYRNESPDNLADLKFKFDYPNGFTTSAKSVFDFKNLKAGEGDRISIKGVLRGGEREGKTVAVTLQRKIGDLYVDFEKSSANTVISTPPLSMEILVNDQKDYGAQLADELAYQVKFNNNTDTDIFGLTISAKLEGTMFDFNTVRGDGFFNSATKTITWNASVSPLLNHLAPRQTGAVSFHIKIKSNFSGSGGVKDSIVKISAAAETLTIPPGFDLDHLSAQAELVTKIVSLPSLTQKGFRQDTTLGATGPMPPKAGQKTSYIISWEIVNIPNDILKARVRGVLPAGVEWENKMRVSGQQPMPTFNSGSREVVWNLETVPAGTGGQFPKYQGWFMVSATPSTSQVGQAIKLIKGAFLEGEDGFTKQDILVRVNDVTTGDLVDFPGNGNVVE